MRSPNWQGFQAQKRIFTVYFQSCRPKHLQLPALSCKIGTGGKRYDEEAFFMIADEQVTTEPSSLFSAQDQAAIRAQLKKRLILVLIPVLALLGAAIYFAIQRNEVATDVLTIVSLAVLIFCYDLFLKPLRCYQRHLDNVISGRRRAVDLPFLAISDDISLVDGVPYRAMTCSDLDAKGRPYDRLFYFDAEKPFPAIAAGETVRVVHHELDVSDVVRV
jgi:hypothetical protein